MKTIEKLKWIFTGLTVGMIVSGVILNEPMLIWGAFAPFMIVVFTSNAALQKVSE